MAIRDVLWGCPLCRTTAALQRRGRRECCMACGAEFRRGTGATIVARHGSTETVRTAGEWLRVLGEPEFTVHPETGIVLGPEDVLVRMADRERPLHHAGELLGFLEEFGPRAAGSLTLSDRRLTFRPARAAGVTFDWQLCRITVVQPASSDLQVAAGLTVASIRFPHSSARLWTRAIVSTLRRFHAEGGREVVEFQPLIRTRLVGQSVR